jgi:hypothetical protein
MDSLELIAMLTGTAAIGTYLYLDYRASRDIKSLADAISNNPEVLKEDNVHLFRGEIDKHLVVIGPFSYQARKFYRSIVSDQEEL